MILLVTNKQDLTTDLVVLALRARGVPFARLNTEDWIERCWASLHLRGTLLSGCLSVDGTLIAIDDVRAVYYRRPTTPQIRASGLSSDVEQFVIRESRALMELVFASFPAYWINHPHSINLAGNRIAQLRLAAAQSFLVPETIYTSNGSVVGTFLERHPEGAIVKTIRSPVVGSGPSKAFVYSTHITPRDFSMSEDLKYSPLIIQQWIDKRVDIRVTVVGASVFAIEIHSQNEAEGRFDWRAGTVEGQDHSPHDLPKQLQQRCIDLTRAFNLDYAAIDLVLDRDGSYYFLELNPNGEWAWIQTRVGLRVGDALVDLLCASDSRRPSFKEKEAADFK